MYGAVRIRVFTRIHEGVISVLRRPAEIAAELSFGNCPKNWGLKGARCGQCHAGGGLNLERHTAGRAVVTSGVEGCDCSACHNSFHDPLDGSDQFSLPGRSGSPVGYPFGPTYNYHGPDGHLSCMNRAARLSKCLGGDGAYGVGPPRTRTPSSTQRCPLWERFPSFGHA